MIENYITPKSTVTASDLLKALIISDPRFSRYPNPTIYEARYMADKIRDERGWFIDAQCLLNIWSDLDKHGTLNQKG